MDILCRITVIIVCGCEYEYICVCGCVYVCVQVGIMYVCKGVCKVVCMVVGMCVHMTKHDYMFTSNSGRGWVGLRPIRRAALSLINCTDNLLTNWLETTPLSRPS